MSPVYRHSSALWVSSRMLVRKCAFTGKMQEYTSCPEEHWKQMHNYLNWAKRCVEDVIHSCHTQLKTMLRRNPPGQMTSNIRSLVFQGHLLAFTFFALEAISLEWLHMLFSYNCFIVICFSTKGRPYVVAKWWLYYYYFPWWWLFRLKALCVYIYTVGLFPLQLVEDIFGAIS